LIYFKWSESESWVTTLVRGKIQKTRGICWKEKAKVVGTFRKAVKAEGWKRSENTGRKRGLKEEIWETKKEEGERKDSLKRVSWNSPRKGELRKVLRILSKRPVQFHKIKRSKTGN